MPSRLDHVGLTPPSRNRCGCPDRQEEAGALIPVVVLPAEGGRRPPAGRP
jgi:hypothetical protein